MAVELTSQMLATLFDFPFEQRRLLPRVLRHAAVRARPTRRRTEAARQAEMYAILDQFVPLWNERSGNAAPAAT